MGLLSLVQYGVILIFFHFALSQLCSSTVGVGLVLFLGRDMAYVPLEILLKDLEMRACRGLSQGLSKNHHSQVAGDKYHVVACVHVESYVFPSHSIPSMQAGVWFVDRQVSQYHLAALCCAKSLSTVTNKIISLQQCICGTESS